MDKKKRAAIKEDNSDFEHLKAWQNNPDLGYYRSEKHWNVHVNIALYRMLSQFYETIGVYEYLQRPLASNRDLFYGYLLNEAYRLCHIVLTSDVPDAKMSYLFDEAETLIIRDWNIPAGHLPPQPNFVDRILSYHILGVVNVILSFANDQKDSIDRFLYDLSLYNDEGVVYNGMHQSFKTYYKQYEQFVAVGLIFSSALRPGYDYKGKDDHLRRKILLYKYIAEELEEKRAAAEKKTVAENDAVMEESVLDQISPTNLRVYYEGWRNGKHGSICQKDGIYRFVEMARGKSGMVDDVNRNEEDNPIVAKGIVAYWLQFNSRIDTVIKRLTKYNCEIPKDIREQFDTYTQIRFEQFRREHRDDPNTWDWDWDREFYANVIIPHEMAFNKMSEALFDYISDSDIVLVRGVMNSYIKYLKKIRTEKGYQVNSELLVLRAIESGDDTKQEDLEEFEVNTILEDLERKGCIKVCWILGHKPWTIALLDRGRAYLKQLEEGGAGVETISIVETKPVVTTQQPPKEHKAEISPQTPKMPLAHKKSSHIHLIEDEEWDDTFDYIFNEKVKPQEIMRALVGIVRPKKISEVRFYYVSCRILEILNYLTEDALRTDFMRWINIHFKCGWPDDKEHKRRFSFALEGSSKNLENQHPSQWDENTIKGGSGIYHHQLAIKIKNAFTKTIINGEAIDDSNSFDHLIDRGQYLRFATHLRDNDYYIPEEAYINNGK